MDRTERGERILNAAADVLLAWGYRRLTIEDIARRAKVGKGTVYLHWKTKESLLLAVVLRSKLRGQHRQLERMRADPREVLLSRVMSGAYRDVLDDPVLRALYLDESDVQGRLNDIAGKELSGLMAEGHRVLRRHLDILRGHGLVRTDLDPAHQQHACMATTIGFLTADSLLAGRVPDDADTRSEVLRTVLASALETPAADGPAAVTATAAGAAPEIIALHEHLAELHTHEMRRQLRE